MQAFVNSLEAILILVAHNSGLDPTDIITELRARHIKGMHEHGIDVHSKSMVNTIEAGLIEPLSSQRTGLENLYRSCLRDN